MCDKCEYAKWLSYIDSLLDIGEVKFDHRTKLTEHHESIESSTHVTDDQKSYIRGIAKVVEYDLEETEPQDEDEVDEIDAKDSSEKEDFEMDGEEADNGDEGDDGNADGSDEDS